MYYTGLPIMFSLILCTYVNSYGIVNILYVSLFFHSKVSLIIVEIIAGQA